MRGGLTVAPSQEITKTKYTRARRTESGKDREVSHLQVGKKHNCLDILSKNAMT